LGAPAAKPAGGKGKDDKGKDAAAVAPAGGGGGGNVAPPKNKEEVLAQVNLDGLPHCPNEQIIEILKECYETLVSVFIHYSKQSECKTVEQATRLRLGAPCSAQSALLLHHALLHFVATHTPHTHCCSATAAGPRRCGTAATATGPPLQFSSTAAAPLRRRSAAAAQDCRCSTAAGFGTRWCLVGRRSHALSASWADALMLSEALQPTRSQVIAWLPQRRLARSVLLRYRPREEALSSLQGQPRRAQSRSPQPGGRRACGKSAPRSQRRRRDHRRSFYRSRTLERDRLHCPRPAHMCCAPSTHTSHHAYAAYASQNA